MNVENSPTIVVIAPTLARALVVSVSFDGRVSSPRQACSTRGRAGLVPRPSAWTVYGRPKGRALSPRGQDEIANVRSARARMRETRTLRARCRRRECRNAILRLTRKRKDRRQAPRGSLRGLQEERPVVGICGDDGVW